jgi:ATP-binding cassette subfamily F protein 2
MVCAAKAAKRAEQKAKRAAKEAAKAEKKGSAGGADDTSDQENPNSAAAAAGLSKSVSQVSLSKSDNQPWDEDHGRSTTGVLASHPQSRDIQIDSFTLLFHGHELLADTRLELNYGRRYGLLGLNGCGKSCMLQVGCACCSCVCCRGLSSRAVCSEVLLSACWQMSLHA